MLLPLKINLPGPYCTSTRFSRAVHLHTLCMVRVPRIAPSSSDGALGFELHYSVKLMEFHWTPPEAYSGGYQVASLLTIITHLLKPCQQ